MKKSISNTYILSVAFPIMIGMFVQFTVIIIDGAFLNRVGTIEFNANGNAGMLYVTLFMLAMGVANGLQVMVARRDGEQNFEEAGDSFKQGLIFLTLLSFVFIVLLQLFSHLLLPQFVNSIPTSNMMQRYLDIRVWGFIFSMIVIAYQGFYSGIANTKIIMYYTSITAVVNVILDYLMIFGKGGFPAMGLEGGALATLLSEITAFIFVILYSLNDKSILKYKLYSAIKWQKPLMKRLLNLSWPLMLQGFISTGTWTIFFFFIEQLGEKELEISQTIRMFYLITLIPVLGLGAATRTFVSQLLADNRYDDVIKTVRRIIIMNLLATFCLTFPNLFFPLWIVPIINSNAYLLHETAITLQIVTGAMFLLALSMPLLNLISGAGDSKTAFKIEVFSISVYLIGAYFITVLFPQDITIVWCLEYLYFSLMVLASFYYIKKGKWKTINI